RLTGAEDALVTNNNAAAVLLILSALGQGREAIISRGQLVEIGGGFRIPDVMRQSGVSLVEVGTTNRTYATDFDSAVTERTALVAISRDKLLGGPQAGVIVGRAAEIGQLRKHPLMRAIRPDKLTLAALGATLVHYLRDEAEREVPVWRMIATSATELERRARTLATALDGQAVETRSAIGGGSLPGQTQPSWAVAFDAPAPDRLAAGLRRADPPVIARIEDKRVLLDLRAILPEQDALLERAVRGAQ